ncbi:M50 family peptidase [Occultella glacieicola]|uniref:M50 family peptidase n=1 Tax=Occultella glacieicola TaxID=2518684 RepID=A0ABY2E905_9MICO|nr:M50 family peptidase [Occultella glacieicola]
MDHCAVRSVITRTLASVDLWDELGQRVLPSAAAVALDVRSLYLVLGIALAVVVIRPAWNVARLGVTLVHELGHALVGVVFGRQFTGFVLRADMSGHAVTRGPSRGFGRAASTWAGYPAPAIVGTLMVWAAARGWAAPVLTAVLLILVLSLIRVRSLLTAVVMIGVIAGTGALWWWRTDALQQQVLIGAGLVLVVGAWRHVGAVLRDRGGSSDPAVLASLTRVPKALWNLTFLLVCAAASWVCAVEVLALRG